MLRELIPYIGLIVKVKVIPQKQKLPMNFFETLIP